MSVLDGPTLPFNECFGPTIQGEGPHAGHLTYFVRLGLCNLSCEWCDTPYTWDAERFDLKAENPDTTPSVILDHLAGLGAREGDMITLSGGEPLMHHTRLPHLLTARYRWHVETNGTIAPPEWWTSRVEHTTVSPKVITASDPEKKRIKPTALAGWNDLAKQGRAIFKFVVASPDHVRDVAALVNRLDLHRPAIWLMPEGTCTEDVLHNMRKVAEATLEQRFNLTTRLHTLLWDDERAR